MGRFKQRQVQAIALANALALAVLFLLPPALHLLREPELEYLEIASVARLRSRFEEAGYGLNPVLAGAAPPPLILAALPSDWSSLEDPATRKATFIQVVLPLVLRENARILDERRFLLQVQARRAKGRRLGDRETRRLEALARRYGLQATFLDGLLTRTDTIPVSLALTQAAVESGWGTSRFAREGNALYGEWTAKGRGGMAPKDRDPGKGYEVRRFEDLSASVASYMHNLNTHRAYRGFRAQRARLRREGLPLDGLALTTGLHAYSERGEDYVHLLRRVIVENQLSALDHGAPAAEPDPQAQQYAQRP